MSPGLHTRLHFAHSVNLSMRIYLNSQKVHLGRFSDSLKSLLEVPNSRKNHSWCNFSPKWKAAWGYSVKLILIYLFQNPLSSGDFKILLQTTSDYLFTINFAFIQAICRITKQHITTEEFTHSFSNSILCLNKINTSTSLEDIEEAFIYRDIPISQLKTEK